MIQALKLQNIRSYRSGLFEFEDGVNIIVGPNASGKTNLLEAIHIVSQGAGFKSSDRDMVSYERDWARIDAATSFGERIVKIKVDQAHRAQKSFELEEVEKKRLTPSSRIPLVLFEPGHMMLLGGEPERRRSYIDGILQQTEPGYRTVLNDYRRTLAQRNRLLKQERVDRSHVFAWDVRLSELAGKIVAARTGYLATASDSFGRQYRSISDGSEDLTLAYESKISTDTYSDSLLRELKVEFELDRLRGYTGAGPHRDDIAVGLDGVEARLSASRGETRSIVLALKIIELEHVAAHSREKPLLLLDDVFSELDGARRRKLAEALAGFQSFITTTDADAIIKSFMKDYNVIATGTDKDY